MFQLAIDDQLASRLKAIAEREQRPIEEVLESMVERHETFIATEHTADERALALEEFIGAIDDDVTDASMTVRETMAEYYRQKYDGTD